MRASTIAWVLFSDPGCEGLGTLPSMNVEDSYEGAIQRLRRLGHAGIELSRPAPLSQQLDEAQQRLRDVEELATLACDDNERLTRELDAARGEIARLQRQVSMLQESVAGAQYEDALAATRSRGRGAAFWFFAICVVGAAAAAAFVLRPWERLRPATAVVAMPEPAAPIVAPPTVTAPPVVAPPVVTAPKLATPPAVTTPPAVSAPPDDCPKAAPMIPKAAPMIPKAAPVVAAASPRHHAAKHHASKRARHEGRKHGAAAHAGKSASPSVGDTDDPLGGVNL